MGALRSVGLLGATRRTRLRASSQGFAAADTDVRNGLIAGAHAGDPLDVDLQRPHRKAQLICDSTRSSTNRFAIPSRFAPSAKAAFSERKGRVCGPGRRGGAPEKFRESSAVESTKHGSLRQPPYPRRHPRRPAASRSSSPKNHETLGGGTLATVTDSASVSPARRITSLRALAMSSETLAHVGSRSGIQGNPRHIVPRRMRYEFVAGKSRPVRRSESRPLEGGSFYGLLDLKPRRSAVGKWESRGLCEISTFP